MERPCFLTGLGLNVLIVICTMASLSGETGTPDIEQLFTKLGAEEYRVREEAQGELVVWGKKEKLEERVAFFRRAQQETNDPEVQERCKEIVRELVKILVEEDRDGFMGITMGGVGGVFRGFGQQPEPSRGVMVIGVIKGTAADKFGLKEGDLILKIDDLELSGVRGTDKLKNYVSGKKSGARIEVQVEREDKTLTVPLTLMPRPRVADLPSRQRFAPNSGFPENLTEAEEEELERMRDMDVEKWLRENRLEE